MMGQSSFSDINIRKIFKLSFHCRLKKQCIKKKEAVMTMKVNQTHLAHMKINVPPSTP
jgi:hypothetical protein